MKAPGLLFLLGCSLSSQVYSPSVLLRNQPDATNLRSFAESILRNADAHTPRAKAEAIWRFFLTDGRFVEPGFWYHIAGWAYEEPNGEVLDPMKLLNSYGFGLCYHVAPLLEAVFEAAGFEDARVWFLTGHTVAEVYYEGRWHYFDSDMMGYNVAGDGSFQDKPVASVRDLEQDATIIVGKMQGPRTVKKGTVDTPWYPADVRAAAMPDLARLFTSAHDNYLFPFTRYSLGHAMNYVLRPGEKIIRFFEPEEPSLYYLPYAFDGKQWHEFPTEIARYGIRTESGPRSQKDDRLWGTGRIEYTPLSLPSQDELTFAMPSPWVIIDAQFTASVELESAESWLSIETSKDGHSWVLAGRLAGPYKGEWKSEPKVITASEHGRLTAVSGTYGYQVRVRRNAVRSAKLDRLTLITRFQHNPRTLPVLSKGTNEVVYRSGPAEVREPVPVTLSSIAPPNLGVVSEQGQEAICPESGSAQTVLRLPAGLGFDFGARFLDIRGGLAPDKLTAETRASRMGGRSGAASVEWSTSAGGPWQTAWTFPPKAGAGREAMDRALRWPEAFISIRDVPAANGAIHVRLRTSGPCIDSIRAAVWRKGSAPSGKLRITHVWDENGSRREHVQTVSAADQAHTYKVGIAAPPRNVSVKFETLP